MKTTVYNQEGKKMESEMILPKEIFEVPMNSDLIYQVTVSQISNRRPEGCQDKRQIGSKGWRNKAMSKGTGRARHGSIRSPLWIGGGVPLIGDYLLCLYTL